MNINLASDTQGIIFKESKLARCFNYQTKTILENIDTLGALDQIPRENTLKDNLGNSISFYDAIVCAFIINPLKVHLDSDSADDLKFFLAKLKSRIFNMMKKETISHISRSLHEIIS